jgi:1-acyl-sn-glycerol-3-phosphate acyltransferase
MHGLGKALPKGSSVLVPFNCTVNVGEPLYGTGSYNDFMQAFEERIAALGAEETKPAWE